jgi:UPF0716 protein FxsA
MFIRLLLLFTIVPVVELYALLEVGSRIGAGPTIVLILLTGVAGAFLAKLEGFSILHRMRLELSKGRLPAGALLDGAMVLTGGVLLLTPGFLTDLLGFSFLIPFTRSAAKRLVRLWMARMIARGDIHIINRR